jgi:hypothetical protein
MMPRQGTVLVSKQRCVVQVAGIWQAGAWQEIDAAAASDDLTSHWSFKANSCACVMVTP